MDLLNLKLFYTSKNLKIYVEYSNEIISRNQFINRLYTHGEDEIFNDIDISKIRKVIDNIQDYSITNNFNKSVINIEITNFGGSGYRRLSEDIIKSPDEWFYIKEKYYFWHHKGQHFKNWKEAIYRTSIDSEASYEFYFKCDTIDGLIKFIQNRRENLYKKHLYSN